VPVYYVLLPGKAESIYKFALDQIVQSVDCKLVPGDLHFDFEKGLINSLRAVFPKARLVGCLFHFKQALQRKMKKLGINEKEIQFFMKPGNLDILCIIPIEQMKIGIQYVKSLLEVSNKQKWVQFWNYFERTWIKRYV
jgi:hypothetical protein